MQNEEGGIVEEEFRVAYVVDRVNTIGTAFLGLTLECCRCHDHKFDPITQKDFYSLFAFFQNIDESGQTSYFTDCDAGADAAAHRPTSRTRSSRSCSAQIAAKETQLRERSDDGEAGIREVARRHGRSRQPIAGTRRRVTRSTTIEGRQGRERGRSDEAGQGRRESEARRREGRQGGGARRRERLHVPRRRALHARRSVLARRSGCKPPELPPRQVVLHHSKAPIDAGSRGYELLLEDGHVAFGLHHMWPGNSLKVVTKQAIAGRTTWTHVAVDLRRLEPGGGRAHLRRRRAAPSSTSSATGCAKDITYGGGEPDLAIGYRFRDNGFKGGAVDEFRVFDRALTPLEAAQLAGKTAATLREACDARDRDALFDYYLANVDRRRAKAGRRAARAARAAERRSINPIPEIDGDGGAAAAEAGVRPEARRVRRATASR